MLQLVTLKHSHKMLFNVFLLWVKSQTSKFTYSFNKALPGKHTLDLYNDKSYIEIAILCQLRSCICKLNKYLTRIGVVEDNICSCG